MIWNIDSHQTSFLRFTTEIDKIDKTISAKRTRKKKELDPLLLLMKFKNFKFYSNEIVIYRHEIE